MKVKKTYRLTTRLDMPYVFLMQDDTIRYKVLDGRKFASMDEFKAAYIKHFRALLNLMECIGND